MDPRLLRARASLPTSSTRLMRPQWCFQSSGSALSECAPCQRSRGHIASWAVACRCKPASPSRLDCEAWCYFYASGVLSIFKVAWASEPTAFWAKEQGPCQFKRSALIGFGCGEFFGCCFNSLPLCAVVPAYWPNLGGKIGWQRRMRKKDSGNSAADPIRVASSPWPFLASGSSHHVGSFGAQPHCAEAAAGRHITYKAA